MTKPQAMMTYSKMLIASLCSKTIWRSVTWASCCLHGMHVGDRHWWAARSVMINYSGAIETVMPVINALSKPSSPPANSWKAGFKAHRPHDQWKMSGTMTIVSKIKAALLSKLPICNSKPCMAANPRYQHDPLYSGGERAQSRSAFHRNICILDAVPQMVHWNNGILSVFCLLHVFGLANFGCRHWAAWSLPQSPATRRLAIWAEYKGLMTATPHFLCYYKSTPVSFHHPLCHCRCRQAAHEGVWRLFTKT